MKEQSHTFKIEGKYGDGIVRLDLFQTKFVIQNWVLSLQIDRPMERTYYREWKTGFGGITIEDIAKKYQTLLKKYSTDTHTEGTESMNKTQAIALTRKLHKAGILAKPEQTEDGSWIVREIATAFGHSGPRIWKNDGTPAMTQAEEEALSALENLEQIEDEDPESLTEYQKDRLDELKMKFGNASERVQTAVKAGEDKDKGDGAPTSSRGNQTASRAGNKIRLRATANDMTRIADTAIGGHPFDVLKTILDAIGPDFIMDAVENRGGLHISVVAEKAESDGGKCTVRDCILAKIKAEGPVTVRAAAREVLDQVQGIHDNIAALNATRVAIIAMVDEGELFKDPCGELPEYFATKDQAPWM